MADVDVDFATLEDALRAHHGHPVSLERSSTSQLSSRAEHKRRIFRAVFQTDISQPTPYATPVAGFPEQGQPFGVPAAAAASAAAAAPVDDEPPQFQASDDLILPDANHYERASGGQRGAQQWTQRQGSGLLSLVPATAEPLGREAVNDQIRFDRAWHLVTARIALPSSVALEDSFGTLAPESQIPTQDVASEQEFQEALGLLLFAQSAVPLAVHTEDILAWHTQQVRRHYVQHVLPLLSACADGSASTAGAGAGAGAGAAGRAEAAGSDSRYYEHHMAVVVNSVRTLEAAFRQYFYGLALIARGLPAGGRRAGTSAEEGQMSAESVLSRFRQDVYALVANSASQSLMQSMRAVFTRMFSILLGLCPSALSADTRAAAGMRTSGPGPCTEQQQQRLLPQPPDDDNPKVHALRQQVHELLVSMQNVGLAGERFQIVFAEIMNEKMVEFIRLSFAGRWAATPAKATATAAGGGSGNGGDTSGVPRPAKAQQGQTPPPSIVQLYDWIENHFARLAHEVLGQIGKDGPHAVSLSHVKQWKDMGLERLSALRMTELFDIVLHWPASKTGLEDLRVSVTTPERRSQLVAAFVAAMRKRLLHPACSTLVILQVYIAMIRTFHVLDPSNVLLSSAMGPLQLYLCQRDDAVRIVVDGLLADPEEADAPVTPAPLRGSGSGSGNGSATTVADKIAAATTSMSHGKLSELARILNDPSQQRRWHVDEEDLDWNDMEWMPDPIDAGTNYRRPKSEDVIGTLIGALGSREAFTKEFHSIIAQRLLSPQVVFAKEVKVLNLLKKRFGEGSMQNCEVMVRDIQDSNRLDAIINQLLQQHHQLMLRMKQQRPDGGSSGEDEEAERGGARDTGKTRGAGDGGLDVEFHAKILSRLYWPGLQPENFLLPAPVAEMQKRYEEGYEDRKSRRKLSWLNHLGQARVELELDDRTVALECKPYEASVIYAFQDPAGAQAGTTPARRSLPELVEKLQMDEELAELALVFWVKQGVLRKDAHKDDVYVVVENLSESTGDADDDDDDAGEASTTVEPDQSGQQAPPARSSRRGRSDDAQRSVYWQFIVSMLTNSAASMPLVQIAMMMKMLIAEGFPWSNEELLEFLGEKVADGELELAGGKYRLIKK